MDKFFNTAGLCTPDKHYMVDPLRRLTEIEELIEKAKKQLTAYLDRLGLSEGYLVIFDSRKKDWGEKLYRKEITFNSKHIIMIGV